MEDKFQIEVTKQPNAKSRYEIRDSDLTSEQASVLWNGLNIGNGYRARLRNLTTGKLVGWKA